MAREFLGTGWSFPVSFPRDSAAVAGNTVSMSQGEQDIAESLLILLNTGLGERVMRPEFGANMEDLLFESLNVTTASMIVNRLKRAILFHEPRVRVENIDLLPDRANGRIQVTVTYLIISTNTRTNIVFPFYLDEGNNI